MDPGRRCSEMNQKWLVQKTDVRNSLPLSLSAREPRQVQKMRKKYYTCSLLEIVQTHTRRCVSFRRDFPLDRWNFGALQHRRLRYPRSRWDVFRFRRRRPYHWRRFRSKPTTICVLGLQSCLARAHSNRWTRNLVWNTPRNAQNWFCHSKRALHHDFQRSRSRIVLTQAISLAGGPAVAQHFGSFTSHFAAAAFTTGTATGGAAIGPADLPPSPASWLEEIDHPTPHQHLNSPSYHWAMTRIELHMFLVWLDDVTMWTRSTLEVQSVKIRTQLYRSPKLNLSLVFETNWDPESNRRSVWNYSLTSTLKSSTLFSNGWPIIFSDWEKSIIRKMSKILPTQGGNGFDWKKTTLVSFRLRWNHG